MLCQNSIGGRVNTTMTEHIVTGPDHYANLSFGNAFHTFENSPWTQVSNLTPTIGWDTMAQAMVQNDEDDDDVMVIGETSGRESTIRPTVRQVSDSELKLTLKYRAKVVKCVSVNIRNGFRVCYNLGLRSGPTELTFPEKDECFFGDSESKTRSKLYKLTKDVLANLEDGIEFSISDGVIFATRRCRAKLYCYSSQLHHGQNPVKLERDVPVQIYNYNHFKDSLKEFYIHQIDPEGIRTTFPKPKIFVSCAQAWKPMHDLDRILNALPGGDTIQPTSLNDCLVTMEIVPLKAIDFIMALPESRENTESVTMSIGSDHLQISN